MDYPFDILFSDKAASGAIRLQVAAICASIDHGYFENTALTDSELAPFTESSEYVSRSGKKLDCWLKPHAFLLIKPTGNLERAVTKILNALVKSILTGEIKPIQLRKSLIGEVDVLETWISMKDLQEWCEIRSIETGDLCSQYSDDEVEITIAAQDAADSLRSKLEAPYFDKHFNERPESGVEEKAVPIEQFRKLLAENVAMRAGKFPEMKEDRPMTTKERNTLLTIIASLCAIAGYDYKRHAKTAALIQNAAAGLGLNIGETTIENHLKKISAGIESRTK